MKITSNYAVMPKFNNKSKLQSQPLKPETNEVSFQGGKKAVVAGIASGLLAGYYLTAATILPPAVKSTMDKEYLHKVELKAVSAQANDNQYEKDELVDEMLDRTEAKPNDNLTKQYIKLVDKYDILDKAAKRDLETTLNKASEKQKLDKESKEFYNKILADKTEENF